MTGVKWRDNTVLGILKNVKYQGDVLLQRMFTTDHVSKHRKENKGHVDSIYIKENHPAIVSQEDWEAAQALMQERAEAKGNFKGSRKQNTHYPLTGMLICSKCGETLIRRVKRGKEIGTIYFWQCRNYIKHGKDACSGTTIEESIISKRNLTQKTVVKEELTDGHKHYTYTRQSKPDEPGRKPGTPPQENGSILPRIDGSSRTAIKL